MISSAEQTLEGLCGFGYRAVDKQLSCSLLLKKCFEMNALFNTKRYERQSNASRFSGLRLFFWVSPFSLTSPTGADSLMFFLISCLPNLLLLSVVDCDRTPKSGVVMERWLSIIGL